MPFKSYRQFKFMMAKHPGIAKRWIGEGHGVPKKPAGYKPGRKIRVYGRKRRGKKKSKR